LWAYVPVLVLLLGESKTPTASSEHDASRTPLIQCQIVRQIVRVLERLASSRERQRDGTWYVLAIFGIELGFPIKIDDLGGDLHGQLRNVKAFNPANTTYAIAQCLPVRFPTDTYRSYTPHPRDYYAAWSFEAAQHDELGLLRSTPEVSLRIDESEA